MLPGNLVEGIRKYADGDFGGAIRHLEQAVKAGQVPVNMRPTIFMMLSRAHEAKGDKDIARRYLEQSRRTTQAPVRTR
jgi:uncharacterized protein HemY